MDVRLFAFPLRADGLGQFERVADGAVLLAAEMIEVAAQELERVAFLLDFQPGANTEAAKERHRRAPALDRVLQKEAGHGEGENKPLASGGDGEN